MNLRRLALAWLACALAGSGWARAQEPLRGPDGGTSSHVTGVGLLPIPGIPFSADTSTEWTRRLEDGNTVVERLTAKLARDGQGRMYREDHHFVPGSSTDRSPLYEIHVSDPTARAQFHCWLESMACSLTDYRPATTFHNPEEGVNVNGSKTVTRESLGADTIEGIYVTGTRETTTVAPGVVGNEHALVATREFWYCDELKTNLVVIRDDPRTGHQVIRLSHIQRGEPKANLFEVPMGYKVVDTRAKALRREKPADEAPYGSIFPRRAPDPE